MRIDAHHHLWDLNAVHYPWVMAKGEPRFFGDPTPIQRDYLLDEFAADASAYGFEGSVHIQVGAADPLEEAVWVQSVADANPSWPMVQVAFCDLTAPDADEQLDSLQNLSTVRGVRQIIGRAPGEDTQTGTNDVLDNPLFAERLRSLANRGLSFDLQLLPELMEKTAEILATAPNTKVALCHAGSPYDRSVSGIKLWSANLRTLSGLQNVYCKLSGLGMFEHNWTETSLRPIIDTVFDQFTFERTMFGSNFPVDSLTSNYEKLFETYSNSLKDAQHDAFFGRTAQVFYGLGS
ncbi:MAG: amidohydrolase family protein [Cognatishimia sp.]|uniref:amidohydrolase family protein n=1 Tax=Cognatishimia sp. TaxID=2211648 RepID=UPI003B8C5B3F